MKNDRIKPCHSSKKDTWATPDWLFQQCYAEFGPFDLDAAASADNAKCDTWIDEEANGLKVRWRLLGERVWLNPPYGRGITGHWVRKAHEESLAGCTVVMLLPARTDAPWFHDVCQKYGEVRFLRGRVRFEGAESGAPFPSMLVIFRPPKKMGALERIERTLEINRRLRKLFQSSTRQST